jgi:iron complex outermembrane receptor protein
LTLLQDGIPINLADDNGDFQELEPIFFDHLEVYRGANALRFGSGTLGGAINGVTPTGDNARGIYGRLDTGSFGLVRGLVSGGFGDQRANAWFGLSADAHDGDRDHAHRSSVRFQGNVGLRVSPRLTTRFYASVNLLDQELPGALAEAVALTAPRTAAPDALAGDQARDINSLRLQNRTTLDRGRLRLEAGVFLNAKELYHPIFQVIDQQTSDKGGFARAEWHSHHVEATLGGESRWGDIASRRFVNLAGERGAKTFDADQHARTSTVYGEIRVKPVARLSLIAGAIYADGSRRQAQTLPAPVIARADYHEFSPKLGVLWQPRPTIQVFANYSRSAEFPTFIELAQVASFVPLRAQTAWTAEVGTRGKLGPVSWDIAVYRARLRRELLQFTVDANIPAATFNADRTIHQGIEAGLDIRPARWLRLRQVWQYSDFRFDGDRQYGDNRLPVIPRHVLRSEVRFGSDRLHVAPSLEWVPQGPWADYRNTLRTPGYALLGLSAGAIVRDGIDLFLDVRNLTAKNAIGDVSAVVLASPAAAIYYPVERRAIYGGVRARF